MFGDAEAYKRFMDRWSSLLAPRLIEFVDLPDGGRVLDVGSGTGALALAVAVKNPHSQVVGIDPSAEYAAYANSRNPFPDRAKFQTGDAQRIDFPDAAFDHSLSLLAFNFIPDRKRALAEVARVTRPGGLVSAAVWDYGEGMRMLRVFWNSAVALDPAAEKSDEKHMPLCRAGELARFWGDGGLEQIEERPLEITLRFASFTDYWEPFLVGQGPAGVYVRKLDDRRRRALRGEVQRVLAVQSEDAPFTLPARAWAVRGRVHAGIHR